LQKLRKEKKNLKRKHRRRGRRKKSRNKDLLSPVNFMHGTHYIDSKSKRTQNVKGKNLLLILYCSTS
jgi:hypothetical protein